MSWFSRPVASTERVASPCTDVCKMEGELCIGCFRTLDEIVRWSQASDDERREILAAVAQRRAERDPDADLNCNCHDG